MAVLHVDIETFSSVDLPKSGVYAYCESSDFQILLFAYAWAEGAVEVVDLCAGEEIPPDILQALFQEEVIKTAFNANFERVCLARYLGQKLPPRQWSCTAVWAREQGLPSSLAEVGAALHLPQDKQKDKEGKSLLRYFACPCTPTRANGYRSRNLPHHAPEKWKHFVEYNRQDVVAEQEIRAKLSPILFSEQKLWELDQHINDRGVVVDLALVKQAVALDLENTEQCKAKAVALTGLENPNSIPQLKKWVEEQSGVPIKSLDKETIPQLKKSITNEKVLQMLELRGELSKTSVSKYEAILRSVNTDGRVRGLCQFYGASRTGRWAGRLVQVQNLPRNVMPDRELACGRDLVLGGNLEALRWVFDDVSATLSELVRTAFVPKKGHRFIVADFSAIEARVIAWLAGEQWRMEVFHSHGKIYEASAEQMFHLPQGSVGKHDPMRQKGKLAELALGYGGSEGALINMGALQQGLAKTELKPLVDRWRKANPKITRFWWDCDRNAQKTIQTAEVCSMQYGMGFYRLDSCLKFRLPSGRSLSYANPQYLNGEISYSGKVSNGKKWGRVSTYGPKLVENIVQAVARDCLAFAMERLEQAGFPIVFHVHDEVICEVPEGHSSAQELGELMSQEIPWAKGLPLKAEAYECHYYRKE